MASRVGAKQLLWIDVQGRERADLDAVGNAVGLEPKSLERLADPPERADLTLYPEHIHLVLQVTEPPADRWSPGRSATGPPPGRHRGRPELGRDHPRRAARRARPVRRHDRG